jgi:DNA-binding response OmpR family regulator
MSDQQILVVEDETTLAERRFTTSSVKAMTSLPRRWREALELARDTTFDLIVLDVMLPTLDGLSIVRILRKEQRTPIILLTARSGEVDRIMGLETGADDYVVKPFSLGELLARVRAVLRRSSPEAATALQAGDLALDLIGRKATRGEQELRLSHRSSICWQPFAMRRFCNGQWGYDYPGHAHGRCAHPLAAQRSKTMRRSPSASRRSSVLSVRMINSGRQWK